MDYQTININSKFAQFDDHWAPRVIAEMNDYQFKLVKLEGEFVWHSHADTDETFIVIDGTLRIEFSDGHVDVGAGEMYVVPKGVEHRPVAVSEVKVMLVEPRNVINTGDTPTERAAAQNDVWI